MKTSCHMVFIFIVCVCVCVVSWRRCVIMHSSRVSGSVQCVRDVSTGFNVEQAVFVHAHTWWTVWWTDEDIYVFCYWSVHSEGKTKQLITGDIFLLCCSGDMLVQYCRDQSAADHLCIETPQLIGCMCWTHTFRQQFCSWFNAAVALRCFILALWLSLLPKDSFCFLFSDFKESTCLCEWGSFNAQLQAPCVGRWCFPLVLQCDRRYKVDKMIEMCAGREVPLVWKRSLDLYFVLCS